MTPSSVIALGLKCYSSTSQNWSTIQFALSLLVGKCVSSILVSMALSSHHCLLFCATEIFCGTYQGDITCFIVLPEVGLGERPGVRRPPPPHHLILGKNKKRIVEGRKTGRASNKQPGPPLSSRSGSATDYYNGKFIQCEVLNLNSFSDLL